MAGDEGAGARARADGPRFAANLKWLFADLPIQARIAAVAENGFRAVEYPDPYEHSVSSLNRMLAGEGIELVMINTRPRTVSGRAVTGIACDPSQRAQFRADLEVGLEYATAAGVSLLHVVGGPVPDGVSAERAWAEYLLNVAWAVDAARSTDITLLIEPQSRRASPGFVITTQSQAATVIDAVGSDRLKTLFDVFHVQSEEGDVSSRLVEHAPLIGHVQIADPPGRTEPGTGELSWTYVFGVLRRIGYRGWVGCEYSATRPEAANVAWLTALVAS